MSEAVQRGLEAERLLNEPLLREAFEKVRLGLVVKLEDTAIGDVEGQHTITLCLQTVKQVKRYLDNMVRTGMLEADRAEATSRWTKFMKRTGAIP